MINNFKETVQAMSAKEIIMAMVEGLRNPTTKIDMTSFGYIENSICYGCAATNTICRIGKIDADYLIEKNIDGSCVKILDNEKHMFFLSCFERAIDELRTGSLRCYNAFAEGIGIAQIKEVEGLKLPYLDDEYTEQDLQQYVKLAEAQ